MSSRSGDQVKQPRRKYVSTACTTCRDGKNKCDGAHPVCGSCRKKKKQCVYVQGEDKRRIPVRKAIQIFSDRLAQLEQFIRLHGLEPPPLDTNDAAMIERLIDTLQTSGSSPKGQLASDALEQNAATEKEELLGETIHLEPPVAYGIQQKLPQPDLEQGPIALTDTAGFTYDMTQINGCNQLHGVASGDFFTDLVDVDHLAALQDDNLGFPEWTTDFTGVNAMPLGMTYGWVDLQIPYPDTNISGTDQSLDHSNTPDSSSGSGTDMHPSTDDEGSDDVINEISGRMGSLQVSNDGELRYFGATSNLILRDDIAHFDPWAQSGVAPNRGQSSLESAGVGKTVNASLEDHLINLYFTWQDPTFHVVDRDMYRQAREKHRVNPGHSSYLSETLTNAMCAFGAIYDTRRHEIFPLPLPEFFAKRAKIWLDIELDSPRVATVQALVILSSFEAASTNDARGWLYSGMAVRLSFDLGLHVDMTPYVVKGLMSPGEAEVRKITFWGTFVVDHLWGFYLGRPPCRISNHNPSVQRPAGPGPRYERWVPYGLSEKLPEAISSMEDRPDPIALLPQQWVLLCEVMDEVSHVMYERADVSDTVLQSLADDTASKLDLWRRNLPEALQVNPDKQDNSKCLHHVLVLHMQYHQFMIYIHRPFVSKPASSSPSTSNIRHMHARAACIESATAIANLLRLYEANCPLRFINVEVVSIIFSAAIILVLFSVLDLEGIDKSSLQRHLHTCCKALAELGKTFKNASRTLEILLDIKRKWQVKLVTSEKPKRRAYEGHGPLGTSTKRRKSQLQQVRT